MQWRWEIQQTWQMRLIHQILQQVGRQCNIIIIIKRQEGPHCKWRAWQISLTWKTWWVHQIHQQATRQYIYRTREGSPVCKLRMWQMRQIHQIRQQATRHCKWEHNTTKTEKWRASAPYLQPVNVIRMVWWSKVMDVQRPQENKATGWQNATKCSEFARFFTKQHDNANHKTIRSKFRNCWHLVRIQPESVIEMAGLSKVMEV